MALLALTDLLAGARPGDHMIALLKHEPVTLARWRADILHNAERMRAHHVQRGALVCEEAYWFITGLLALMRIGASIILPPNQLPGTLRELRGEFDMLVTDGARTDRVQPNIILEPSGGTAAPFTLPTERSSMGFFTSGSTGEMKQERKTLDQFTAEARALEELWGARVDGARIFGTVTHQHVFGMTFRLMWPLLAGRPFHSEFAIAWETLLSSLTPRGVIISSPAQLSRMGGLEPLRAGLRPLMVITAGAPLPETAAVEAETILGCAPTEVFGSTEAGVIGWRDSRPHAGLWRTFPGVEVKAGNDGVLLLRSRHASAGDWSEQADRISVGGDGGFRLEGRIDRVVKVEGKRVSLVRMERALSGLVWIADAAVVTLGENPLYLGVVATLAPAGKDEIARMGKFRFARLLRQELAQAEEASVLPRKWRFVETMPMDGLGKRRIADLKALLDQSP